VGAPLGFSGLDFLPSVGLNGLYFLPSVGLYGLYGIEGLERGAQVDPARRAWSRASWTATPIGGPNLSVGAGRPVRPVMPVGTVRPVVSSGISVSFLLFLSSTALLRLASLVPRRVSFGNTRDRTVHRGDELLKAVEGRSLFIHLCFFGRKMQKKCFLFAAA
jgi:hypothetical protein